MYYTLHEADISKFVEIVDEKIREHFKETKISIKPAQKPSTVSPKYLDAI